MTAFLRTTIPATLLAAFLTGPLAGQEPGSDQRPSHQDSVTIHSIRTSGAAPPRDDSDLHFLRDLIGDASIVQLGELNHGSGDSFAARIRITRYLHRELGFDLVLFEIPMFLSRRMNQELSRGRPLADVIDMAVFPIWSHSEIMQGLFSHIRASKQGPRPMDLYGIDAQLMGDPGEADAVVREVRSALSAPLDPTGEEVLDSLRSLVADLQPASGVRMTPDRYVRARTLLDDARTLLETPDPVLGTPLRPGAHAWALRTIRTLEWVTDARALQALAPPFRGDFEAYNAHPAVQAARNRRDRAMAANILWMLREYAPGRKAVVWLANSHAREAPGDLFPGDDRYRSVRRQTVGSYLTAMLGDDEVFTLLQSAYTGGYAGSFVRDEEGYLWRERDLPPAGDGTLERYLHDLGEEAAIVVLDETWPPGLRLRGTLGDEEGHPLHRYGDALLFLDRDRPATPRAGAPTRRDEDGS